MPNIATSLICLAFFNDCLQVVQLLVIVFYSLSISSDSSEVSFLLFRLSLSLLLTFGVEEQTEQAQKHSAWQSRILFRSFGQVSGVFISLG